MSIDSRSHDDFIFATDATEPRYYVAEFEYDESPEEDDYHNPGPTPDDFDETLASIPGAFGKWRYDHTSAEMLAFADAAEEASNLEYGADLLKNAPVSADVTLERIGRHGDRRRRWRGRG